MFNQCTLVGNLGKNPEVKHLENGAVVATFSIATTSRWKTKEGEKKEKTTWHNIVVWRGLAEVVEKYVKKGHRVMIVGEIDNRSYETAEGDKRYITEIIAKDMVMLSSKGTDTGTPSGAEEAGATEPATDKDVQKMGSATSKDADGVVAMLNPEGDDQLPF